MITKTHFLLCVVLLSLGVNVWLLFIRTPAARVEEQRKKSSYVYLSPRAGNYPNDLLLNFLPLRTTLRELTKDYGDTFALYFEYLPTGTSININSQQEFLAVSLLKLPVVMAYYRQKERLHISDKEVTIRQDELDPAFGELWKKGAGQSISLNEAARLALQESDNTALRVLTDNIDVNDFSYVYEGLDIDLKQKDGGVVITAKQYASILKALHFSALLREENSEEILRLLTETKFSEMLPAGVPKSIAIAHKIGVLADNLYLDCGIIYLPQRPYLVCMMSQSNEDEAQKRMKAVSEKIYTYVSSISSLK